MPLESQAFLVDDVLLKIMCFCDIYHVLGLSQANKRFNSLAFSKEVWLAILSDLNARLFVDIPPGQSLRNFSTGELISLAKRTVEGPRSWAPLTSAHPIVSRKVTVPHNRGMQYSRAVHAPQLLPGGHFVLIQSDNLLECWSLSKKQVIWSYEPTWTQDALNWPVPLAAEVVDDDRVVLMVIPARISAPFIEDRQNSVDVVRLNLITAKSETLVHRRAPDTGHDNPFSFCRIQGDFAIVSPTLEHWVVLLRISTSSYLLLNLPTGCEGYRDASDPTRAIDLVSEHLLIAALISSGKRGIRLDAWNLAVLFDTATEGQASESSSAAPHTSQAIVVPMHKWKNHRLVAHQSPIREDTTSVWLFAMNDADTMSLRFHISHPAKSFASRLLLPSGCLTFKAQFPQPYDLSPKICNAGYIEVDGRGQDQRRIYSLRHGSNHNGSIELPDPRIEQSMSAYSGALTYASDKEIVVAYYE